MNIIITIQRFFSRTDCVEPLSTSGKYLKGEVTDVVVCLLCARVRVFVSLSVNVAKRFRPFTPSRFARQPGEAKRRLPDGGRLSLQRHGLFDPALTR